jgi:hypothetical protein
MLNSELSKYQLIPLPHIRLDVDRGLFLGRFFPRGLLHAFYTIALVGDEVDIHFYRHGAGAGDDFF